MRKEVCDVITMFIASTKIEELEGSISPSSFYGELSSYYSHVFQSYLPSGWVLLKGNEDVGWVQDFILLFFHLV